MIILNCTSDYATQQKSIKVTWLLNSMVPDDIRDGKYSRVVVCNSSVVCGNGSYNNEVYCYKQELIIRGEESVQRCIELLQMIA